MHLKTDPRRIVIQHDNATPHGAAMTAEAAAAGHEAGWSISFAFQPPKSPDLNVLDLGFFSYIQSIQHRQ